MALTPKQERFVAEYLIDLNATQAAIRAGYSARTAYSQGQRLLKHVEVAAAIAALQAKRVASTDITFERVREELRRVAMANTRDVVRWGVGKVTIGFDADGKRVSAADLMDAAMVMEVDEPFVLPINSDDLSPEMAATVSEVSLGKEGFKIKMHSKLNALDMLAKMHGYYAPERHVLTGANGGPVEVDATLTPSEAYLKLIGGS